MELSQIALRRMHAQRVWGSAIEAPEDVVRWFGAMQGQEFAYARWSVGQRTRGLDDAGVMEAYSAGRILRAHALRPTWHLIAAEDIRMVLQVTAPRVHQVNGFVYRQQGIDAKLAAKAHALIAKALDGGRQLTRTELAGVLRGGRIEAAGVRLAYLIMWAELDGLICSGAPKGKQHTYALLEERAPSVPAMDDQAALKEFTRRYFTAHGPATANDLSKWASFTMRQVSEGLDLAGSDMERETRDGRTYWFAPSASKAAPPRGPVVDLVQIYDELVMGYSESRDVLTTPWTASVTIDPPLLHAILLDGRLIGHWQPGRSKAEVVVKCWFYRPLDSSESGALDAAVVRYGSFLAIAARWQEVAA